MSTATIEADYEHLVERAILQNADGDAVEATKLLFQATEVDPAGVVAWRVLADVLGSMDNDAAELSVLERAVGLAPDDIELKVRLARKEMALDPESSMNTWIEVTLLEPEHGEAWLSLGSLLTTWGPMADALEALRMAAALCGPNAEVYYRLGLLHERRGKPTDAVAAYEWCLSLEPDHGYAAAGKQRVESS